MRVRLPWAALPSVPVGLYGDGPASRDQGVAGEHTTTLTLLMPLCFSNQVDVLKNVRALFPLPRGGEPELPVPAAPRHRAAATAVTTPSQEQSYQPCFSPTGRLPRLNPFRLNPSSLFIRIRRTHNLQCSLFLI